MSEAGRSSVRKRRETSVRKAKRGVRAEARSKRRALSHSERTRKSLAIEKRLAGTDEYKNCDTILMYASISDEVQTLGLIERAVADGKTVVLPRVTVTEALTLHRVGGTAELRRSKLGILEPVARAPRMRPADIQLAVVPGVAFDQGCHRLGLGKGCYDKLLPRLEGITKIGLAFEAQLVDEIPREAHDRPVDMLVTEKRVIRP